MTAPGLTTTLNALIAMPYLPQTPQTAPLLAAYTAAADACVNAPAGTDKAPLRAERDAAAADYFRGRYEAQRHGLSHIQR